MEAASIGWAVLFVFLLIIELATMGLTTIWFAGGAAAAFICSMLGFGSMVQIVAFFAVSILLLVFTRPFAVRYINRNRTKTNVESLVGADALVLEDVDNIRETGCARLEGKEWTARSVEGDMIPKDTVVTVVRIEGVKLMVRRK